jgi:Ca-activated chloride channel family protein
VAARELARSSLAVLLSLLVSLAGCGGSSASYARFRRAAESGAIVAAEEVRAADFIDVRAEEDAPRPITESGVRAPVLLEARAGHPAVSTRGGTAVVQVSLRGGTTAMREPASIVVVVDVSGSMQDQDKIGAVQHALARFVTGLDARDRIAIVTFADDAHLALPPAEVGAARPTILGAIGALSAYGGTNLGAGLETGVAVARGMRGAGVTRVVLLSDGVATIGDTNGDSLRRWGGMARGERISLTTIGMGEQIDFGLLEGLANDAGGAFHYVDRPAEVDRVFGRELSALTAIAARDAHVRVTLPPGATLVRSYDERTRLEGSVLDTPLGDVAGDEALVVLHEIALPPGLGAASVPVEVTLASPETAASAVVARTTVSFTQSAPAPEPVASDASVLRNLTLGRIAWSVREASHLLDTGDASRAGAFAWSALAEARAARVTLAQRGDASRAASLDEPIALLERTAQQLPMPPPPPSAPAASTSGGWVVTSTSSAEGWAGWR